MFPAASCLGAVADAANVDIPSNGPVRGPDIRSSLGQTSSVTSTSTYKKTIFKSSQITSVVMTPISTPGRCSRSMSFFVRSQTMRSRSSVLGVTCELVFTSRQGACVLSNPGRDLNAAPFPPLCCVHGLCLGRVISIVMKKIFNISSLYCFLSLFLIILLRAYAMKIYVSILYLTTIPIYRGYFEAFF